eukprot:Gb_21695 [translate_table: standard]
MVGRPFVASGVARGLQGGCPCWGFEGRAPERNFFDPICIEAAWSCWECLERLILAVALQLVAVAYGVNLFSEPLEDLEGYMVKLLECLINPRYRLGIVTFEGEIKPWSTSVEFSTVKNESKEQICELLWQIHTVEGRGPFKKMGRHDAQHANLGDSVEDAWTSRIKTGYPWSKHLAFDFHALDFDLDCDLPDWFLSCFLPLSVTVGASLEDASSEDFLLNSSLSNAPTTSSKFSVPPGVVLLIATVRFSQLSGSEHSRRIAFISSSRFIFTDKSWDVTVLNLFKCSATDIPHPS